MADKTSEELERQVSTSNRLTKKLIEHKESLKGAGVQLAGGFAAALGGVAAALSNYYLGSATPGGIKEWLAGPVPMNMTAGVVAKLLAIGLHVSEKDSTHLGAILLGEFGNGLVATEGGFVTYRILSEMGASGAAPAAPAATS